MYECNALNRSTSVFDFWFYPEKIQPNNLITESINTSNIVVCLRYACKSYGRCHLTLFIIGDSSFDSRDGLLLFVEETHLIESKAQDLRKSDSTHVLRSWNKTKRGISLKSSSSVKVSIYLAIVLMRESRQRVQSVCSLQSGGWLYLYYLGWH